MVAVSLRGDGRQPVPREGHCCAVPVKRSRSDQTRRKPNWPCRELLRVAYSQLWSLSCSSFGDCRIGNPVGGGVESSCDPRPGAAGNHESATNPRGIFKFIGSEG